MWVGAGHLARDAVVHELDLAAVGQQDVAPLHVAVEAEVLLQVEEGVQHLQSVQWSGNHGAVVTLVLLTINRQSCTITEEAPTRAFSWLKAPISAFTFRTLLRQYAKRALTPQ